MRYDDAAWLLVCGALSALGVVIAVLTYRKKGWSPGLRVFGWALLPIAVWLTGLSKLVWTTAVETVRWASGLLFSPRVWIGVALFFVSFVVLGGVGFVRRRRRARSAEPESGEAEGRSAAKTAQSSKDSKPTKAEQPAVGKGKPKGKSDDPLEGFEDIDEILKKRGIS